MAMAMDALNDDDDDENEADDDAGDVDDDGSIKGSNQESGRGRSQSRLASSPPFDVGRSC